MKFLIYLEKAWMSAAVVALIVALWNYLRHGEFNSGVYFPLFCSVFCVLLWYNVRSQRLFRETMLREQKKDSDKKPQ